MAAHAPREGDLLPVGLLLLSHLQPLFYRTGGDSTVTGNVTWLSPAAFDSGKADRRWHRDRWRSCRKAGINQELSPLASAHTGPALLTGWLPVTARYRVRRHRCRAGRAAGSCCVVRVGQVAGQHELPEAGGSMNSGCTGVPMPNVSDTNPHRLTPSVGCTWSGRTAHVVGTQR